MKWGKFLAIGVILIAAGIAWRVYRAPKREPAPEAPVEPEQPAEPVAPDNGGG